MVVWVQGCSLRCPGCINADMLPHEPRSLMEPEEIMKIVEAGPGDIEGLTFTGGEPFEQAEGLFKLATFARERGLSVMSYTGYTLEELLAMRDESVRGLLRCLDILVDGRFRRELSGPYLWRGSSNQRIILLTDRYEQSLRGLREEARQMEIEVDAGGISFIGNLQEELISEIAERLKREFGILLGRRGET